MAYDDDEVGGELIQEPNRALAAAPGQTMLQMRTSYSTAMSVPKPRELNQAAKRLLQEARLAGESFYYGWGSGKDRVEGPSVGLAMAAARCWGNCAVEMQPMQETGDAWVFTAAFVDLETGFTVNRQFRQSKRWTVYGKLDAERKDDMRFQIGQSKATRNVILNALPEWLIEQAMDEAKAGVRSKIEKYINDNGYAAAVDMIVKTLAKLGVKEDAIVDKCGVAAVTALNVDQLVILRGDIAALQAGQERAAALFPLLARQEAAAAPQAQGSKSEQLANDLKGKGKKKADPPAKTEEPVSKVANLDKLLADCTMYREARALYDQLCGPDSDLNADDMAFASERCQARMKELEQPDAKSSGKRKETQGDLLGGPQGEPYR
jgi:hypothetical protein